MEEHTKSPPPLQASVDDARRARRRFRSKINQRKYRALATSSQQQLDEDVAVLVATTARLESHREALERGLWCHAEELSILEYFRVMGSGYTHSARQETFLEHFLSPDILCLDKTGRGAVSAAWDAYNTYFASYEVTCERLNPLYASSDFVVVEAIVVGKLQASQSTIQHIFPHLLHRADLLVKMINRDLELSVRVVFTFNASKVLVRLESHPNVVGALLHQFGDLGDVVAVIQTMGMRPNGTLVSQSTQIQE
ncbi:Aste57867_2656 [Aphanomyces stellatus]|uniref:Aste57867_2656 protein n=1 Tax=Aphanomyces stellatus TaxID=120398 RepID=A0A485KBT0_9STRA|nr:hypothetical protein As57867_002649 [Aphanomyces stellatus]VFT79850.1 Aste57867_2656 [Aphanomyces stellatus]